MSAVSEIITQDQIQDLWGCGFTIVARCHHPDPFFVPQEMVPQGRSYQWWHLVHDKFHFNREGHDSGWAPVPASRHDGYFMPFGHVGDIEVGGLGLFDKSKVEVDEERTKSNAAALELIEEWRKKTGALFSGDIKVGSEKTFIGEQAASFAHDGTKTIETTTAIPKDMFPHMSAIFAERDRLRDEVVDENNPNGIILKPGEIADKFKAAIEADDSRPRWPTLHAILLPIAIENVRKSLKQENAS